MLELSPSFRLGDSEVSFKSFGKSSCILLYSTTPVLVYLVYHSVILYSSSYTCLVWCTFLHTRPRLRIVFVLK